MTTTINRTDGSVLTVIADGTVDTTTSLVLIGKNYANYGDFLNENFVHLLENAASRTAPVSPIEGQLWWDKVATTLKVWTGDQFKVISSATSDSVAPENSVVGDLWWDTFYNKLNVYNGSGWTLIGPEAGASLGSTGTLVTEITDLNGDSHLAIKVLIETGVIAVISKDTEYSFDSNVETDLDGFSGNICPGINLPNDGSIFNGTATNATTLAEQPASSYARTDIAETFNDSVTISSNSGLTIGRTTSPSMYTQTLFGNSVVLVNNVVDASGDPFVLKGNIAGTTTALLTVGGNAEVRLSVSPNVANGSSSSGLAVATVENVRTQTGNVLLQDGSRTLKGSLVPESGWTNVNIGSSTTRVSTLHSTTLLAATLNAATIGNSGATLIGSNVNSAIIGNVGTAFIGNTVSAPTIGNTGAALIGASLSAATIGNTGASIVGNSCVIAGNDLTQRVVSLNSQTGTVTVGGSAGITVSTSTGAISVTPTWGYNGYGVRTISSSTPSGGSSGDVWYQV